MESLKNILQNFDPLEDKYISREFQAFGCYLAEKLLDDKHKALYINLAKKMPRPVLEEALRFVVDSRAKSKGGLFMWKLKEMGAFEKMIKIPKVAKKKPGSLRSGRDDEKKARDDKQKVQDVKHTGDSGQARMTKEKAPVFKTTRKRKKMLTEPLF